MPLKLFEGLRPFSRSAAARDVMAGVTLASMNIPQVLGYTRIAGTPVVTGLYTVLLPVVAFAVFGSSRHMVVAADSATAAIFSSSLSEMAPPGSEKYMALVGMVALLPPDHVDRAVQTLADHQIPAWVAGEARLDEKDGGHVTLSGRHPGW